MRVSSPLCISLVVRAFIYKGGRRPVPRVQGVREVGLSLTHQER